MQLPASRLPPQRAPRPRRDRSRLLPSPRRGRSPLGHVAGENLPGREAASAPEWGGSGGQDEAVGLDRPARLCRDAPRRMSRLAAARRPRGTRARARAHPALLRPGRSGLPGGRSARAGRPRDPPCPPRLRPRCRPARRRPRRFASCLRAQQADRAAAPCRSAGSSHTPGQGVIVRDAGVTADAAHNLGSRPSRALPGSSGSAISAGHPDRFGPAAGEQLFRCLDVDHPRGRDPRHARLEHQPADRGLLDRGGGTIRWSRGTSTIAQGKREVVGAARLGERGNRPGTWRVGREPHTHAQPGAAAERRRERRRGNETLRAIRPRAG